MMPMLKVFDVPIKKESWMDNKVVHVILKYEEDCFIRFPNTKKWVEETEAQPSVWKSDEEVF